MIEFTHTEAYGFHHAIRGMRNSWGSHEKSDSEWLPNGLEGLIFDIGKEDLALAMKLSKAGGSHSKFLRQIEVWVDINAPLYWFKQFDQYKVGTTTNSESTMHQIMSKPFTKEMFSLDYTDYAYQGAFIDGAIENLEILRDHYLETKDKNTWKLLIQLLPSGWMQKRTTTLNYAVIRNAYRDRRHHKLTEWHDFCAWAKSLPYSELITGEVENG